MAAVEDDLIHRSAVIDGLNEGAELLRCVLKETGIIGAERVKYEFGLGLIEACIADVKELPPTQSQLSNNPCTSCENKSGCSKCTFF